LVLRYFVVQRNCFFTTPAQKSQSNVKNNILQTIKTCLYCLFYRLLAQLNIF